MEKRFGTLKWFTIYSFTLWNRDLWIKNELLDLNFCPQIGQGISIPSRCFASMWFLICIFCFALEEIDVAILYRSSANICKAFLNLNDKKFSKTIQLGVNFRVNRSFVFQDYTCICARSFGTLVAIAIIGISFGFSPRISWIWFKIGRLGQLLLFLVGFILVLSPPLITLVILVLLLNVPRVIPCDFTNFCKHFTNYIILVM